VSRGVAGALRQNLRVRVPGVAANCTPPADLHVVALGPQQLRVAGGGPAAATVRLAPHEVWTRAQQRHGRLILGANPLSDANGERAHR
jgi:hypothetical protein